MLNTISYYYCCFYLLSKIQQGKVREKCNQYATNYSKVKTLISLKKSKMEPREISLTTSSKSTIVNNLYLTSVKSSKSNSAAKHTLMEVNRCMEHRRAVLIVLITSF